MTRFGNTFQPLSSASVVTSNQQQAVNVMTIEMESHSQVRKVNRKTDVLPSSSTDSCHGHSNCQPIESKKRIKALSLTAGTLSYIIQYILMVTPRQLKIVNLYSISDENNLIDEEKKNVSQIIHVMFATYRLFASPVSLLSEIIQQHKVIHPKPPHLQEQFNFVLLYWLTKYPEDLDFVVSQEENIFTDKFSICSSSGQSNSRQIDFEVCSIASNESSDGPESEKPFLSVSSSSNVLRERKELEQGQRKNVNQSLPKSCTTLPNRDNSSTCKFIDVLVQQNLDHNIKAKALNVYKEFNNSHCDFNKILHQKTVHHTKSTSQFYEKGNLLKLDARFVAAELTAIDLENFVTLKPYHLLEGTKSNSHVKKTVKHFNLLSRRVVITILQSSAPELFTAHWIAIAATLSGMKNFNSLKAVMSGLNNQSIYRLKHTIWSKLSKATLSTFKMLSSVVDDSSNQAFLRQNQLKVTKSTHNSFGSIPFLGTFFTDLTFIDSQYSRTIPSETGQKLINLQKCSKQFEVITQVQLLQKNVKSAFDAHQKSKFIRDAISGNNDRYSFLPDRVVGIFHEWFNEQSNDILSEDECYKLSLQIEPPKK